MVECVLVQPVGPRRGEAIDRHVAIGESEVLDINRPRVMVALDGIHGYVSVFECLFDQHSDVYSAFDHFFITVLPHHMS